jgi:small-conductance mechanosensitive channel
MKTKEVKQALKAVYECINEFNTRLEKLEEWAKTPEQPKTQKDFIIENLRQDLKTSKANNEALIGQLIDSIEKNRIKTIFRCKNCGLDLLKESGTPKICKAYNCNMYAKLKTDIL